MSEQSIVAAVGTPAGHPAKRAFWDVEYREPDCCSRPLMGEERMWANALILAIQDAKGVSIDHNEECLECHTEEHPACFKFLKRKGEDYIYRINKSCTSYHTRQQCAIRWFASESKEFGYPGTDPRRTYLGLCDLLGIASGYLRKSLQENRFDDYWTDEAKIRSFLGFTSGVTPSPGRSDSPDDTGCSGGPGESD